MNKQAEGWPQSQQSGLSAGSWFKKLMGGTLWGQLLGTSTWVGTLLGMYHSS